MKKLLLAMTLALTSSLAWAHKDAKNPERGEGGTDVTVTGELVDMACFMAHEGRGKKHAKCAEQCVLGGAPVGLVTADGKVYLLVEDHSTPKAKKPYAQAKELVAETVTITGHAYERGGVQAVVVESVKKG